MNQIEPIDTMATESSGRLIGVRYHSGMGRMNHWYFVGLLVTAFCSGCPRHDTPMPVWLDESAVEVADAAPTATELASEPVAVPTAPQEPVGLRLCAVPEALEIDPSLSEILDAVADYWSEQGIAVVHSTPDRGCETVIDIGEKSLAKSGEWGTKDAQTWLPNSMSEDNPAITRFRLGFWVDPITTQPLRAALAAHEVGHILLGPQHEPERMGKLMSEVVTDTLADELFGDAF